MRTLPRRFELALLATLALASGACSPLARVDADSAGAALMRNLLSVGRVEASVPAGAAFEPAVRAAARLSRERDGYRVQVVSPGHGVDPGAARIVVGTRADTDVLELLGRMEVSAGIEDGRAWFAWREQAFRGGEDILIATFEDPRRPGLPVTVFAGNDINIVARALGELRPGWKPWMRVWRAGELVLDGPLSIEGKALAARMDRPLAQHVAPGINWVAHESHEQRVRVQTQDTLPAETAEAYVELAARARERTRAWCAPEAELPGIAFSLYALAEDYEHQNGSASLARVEPHTRRVHALCAPRIPSDGGAAAAQVSALALLGDPVEAWIEEGAAIDAAGVWWGQSLERWLAWLTLGDLIPPIAELIDARAGERLSPHLVGPLRAALFRHVLETQGASALRQMWRGTLRLEPSPELEAAFRARLARSAEHFSAEFQQRRAERHTPLALSGPRMQWRGLGVERPSGESERGLGSRGADRGFAIAADLGVDAVALTCFLVDQEDPPARGVSARCLGMREGELELFGGLVAARARKLSTLVEPNLLAAPAGTLSGAWLRTSDDDWQRFFDGYDRALVHCALTAELADADMLSIGTGLGNVTRFLVEGRRGKAEDLEAKRKGWSRVIARSRAAFSGQLCYAATTLDEAQKVGFWSELDAIGLVLSTDLLFGENSLLPDARDELSGRIKQHAQGMAELAQREQRPWFFTQTGFAAKSGAPWLARVGPGSSAPDLVAIQLEVLGAALGTLDPSLRPRGMFLWRWSSDPDDRGVNERDGVLWSPMARETLRKLYHFL